MDGSRTPLPAPAAAQAVPAGGGGMSALVDLVVYGEFADESELARYKAHPTYAASIAIARPLRELRVVADFHAGFAGGN